MQGVCSRRGAQALCNKHLWGFPPGIRLPNPLVQLVPDFLLLLQHQRWVVAATSCQEVVLPAIVLHEVAAEVHVAQANARSPPHGATQLVNELQELAALFARPHVKVALLPGQGRCVWARQRLLAPSVEKGTHAPKQYRKRRRNIDVRLITWVRSGARNVRRCARVCARACLRARICVSSAWLQTYCALCLRWASWQGLHGGLS